MIVIMVPNRLLDLSGSSLRSYAKRKPHWRMWLIRGRLYEIL